MPLLPRRFEKLKTVLNSRMEDLSVLIEHVEKPHNLSAILRSCDAVGVLEAHAICNSSKTPTFNSTAQGSQKWVKIKNHKDISTASKYLKKHGFKLYGTTLKGHPKDYRDCDFTGPTVFVLGAEKWGLSNQASELMDDSIFIPMRGMVQSLNVSVAAAILLFEALRQRQNAGLIPKKGEGMQAETFNKILFEWAYPDVAAWCESEGRKYPEINDTGQIIEKLPRTVKLKY